MIFVLERAGTKENPVFILHKVKNLKDAEKRVAQTHPSKTAGIYEVRRKRRDGFTRSGDSLWGQEIHCQLTSLNKKGLTLILVSPFPIL